MAKNRGKALSNVDSGKTGGMVAAALALVAGAGAADASTVINVPLSAVMGNGGNYSGSFDISSYLNSGGNHYDVTAAAVEVSGFSPQSNTYSAVSGYYTYFAGYYVAGYYSYGCGWFSTCYAPYYAPYYATGTSYVNLDGYQDTLTVDTGEGSGLSLIHI